MEFDERVFGLYLTMFHIGKTFLEMLDLDLDGGELMFVFLDERFDTG